jgi:polysaccharide deacetylase 2 family uncharacterized protein YibQ
LRNKKWRFLRWKFQSSEELFLMKNYVGYPWVDEPNLIQHLIYQILEDIRELLVDKDSSGSSLGEK